MPKDKKYHAIIAAVSHSAFLKVTSQQWINLLEPNGVIFDLKDFIPRELNPIRI